MAVKNPLEDFELDEHEKPLVPLIEAEGESFATFITWQAFLLALLLGWNVGSLARSWQLAMAAWLACFLLVLPNGTIHFTLFALGMSSFLWHGPLKPLGEPGFRTGLALLCVSFPLVRILAGTAKKLSYARQNKLSSWLFISMTVSSIWLACCIKDHIVMYGCFYFVLFCFYMAELARPRTEHDTIALSRELAGARR
jgi:hypothetical protein